MLEVGRGKAVSSNRTMHLPQNVRRRHEARCHANRPRHVRQMSVSQSLLPLALLQQWWARSPALRLQHEKGARSGCGGH